LLSPAPRLVEVSLEPHRAAPLLLHQMITPPFPGFGRSCKQQGHCGDTVGYDGVCVAVAPAMIRGNATVAADVRGFIPFQFEYEHFVVISADPRSPRRPRYRRSTFAKKRSRPTGGSGSIAMEGFAYIGRSRNRIQFSP
jgi:hypothetical protein